MRYILSQFMTDYRRVEIFYELNEIGIGLRGLEGRQVFFREDFLCGDRRGIGGDV
jgi:hypothetical protein